MIFCYAFRVKVPVRHDGALRPLQKGIFLPPALFANAHLLLNKLRFAAELKNKNIRFLHVVSTLCKIIDLIFSKHLRK